ncbi:sulfate adenylyltransferase subunit CysN [Sphingomonas daechungensis]|uniref:sulfate adenylyltransferase subunit CysN n=1 Tax=Sphingomonas daechungensis TaxID=1176646 RepID=UPI003783865C
MATLLKPLDAADTAREELERWIDATQKKSLLRFITCGSVDDGKSTLIGRLLYDSKMLFEDQLSTLASDSKKQGTQGEALDFALLVDGLAAEREQGITIDVAYRFFATEKRKFIVADTPGHEQYTRNMVTGASTADLAVILIDARKGVLTQTKRHSFLVHLLGIRNVVLAVNKMDLVGYDQSAFDRIVEDYAAFAKTAGIGAFTAIPVSGLKGDNITSRSAEIDWYDGPFLLEHLEAVPAAERKAADEPFRMAVQWVSRPSQNFRGYTGRIASGQVRVGDPISVLPAGRNSFVERIVTFDGDLDQAVAGQSVTLTLTDEIDCSRGDILVAAGERSDAVSRISASLVWMSDEKLVPHRSYWLKVGTQTVSASIDTVQSITDVNTLEISDGNALALNDIGKVVIDLDRAIPGVRYVDNRKLGGFILIDKMTHATVAAGLVDDFPANAVRRAAGPTSTITWVTGPDRALWAARTAAELKAQRRQVSIIDEEAIAGFPADDPVRTAREAAKLLAAAGVHVLVTIEARPGEAHPGRVVEASNEDNGGGEWVI